MSVSRLADIKKMLEGGCILAIIISSFSTVPTNSFCMSGLGGYHLKASDEISALISSLSDVNSSSSEEGSATASPAPSGSGEFPARG